MPTAYIKKLADEGKGSIESLEKKWDHAKSLAKEAGHAEEFDYITGIFNKMIKESIYINSSTIEEQIKTAEKNLENAKRQGHSTSSLEIHLQFLKDEYDKSKKNESLNESKKKIGEYAHGSNVTKVYKLTGEHNEGDPYIVQLHKNGKHYEPADYFTNDEEDAHGTAKHMVKESEDPNKVTHNIIRKDALGNILGRKTFTGHIKDIPMGWKKHYGISDSNIVVYDGKSNMKESENKENKQHSRRASWRDSMKKHQKLADAHRIAGNKEDEKAELANAGFYANKLRESSITVGELLEAIGYKQSGMKIRHNFPSNADVRQMTKQGILPGKEEKEFYHSQLTKREKKYEKLSYRKRKKKEGLYPQFDMDGSYYHESFSVKELLGDLLEEHHPAITPEQSKQLKAEAKIHMDKAVDLIERILFAENANSYQNSNIRGYLIGVKDMQRWLVD